MVAAMTQRSQACRGAKLPPARRLAALAAILALLIQVAFALPVAFRMASDMAAMADDDPAMCPGMASEQSGAGDHQMPQPGPGHHHDNCPVCHGSGAAPLALAAALVVAAPVLLAYVTMCHPALGPPAGLRRFQCYASRAPPAAA